MITDPVSALSPPPTRDILTPVRRSRELAQALELGSVADAAHFHLMRGYVNERDSELGAGSSVRYSATHSFC